MKMRLMAFGLAAFSSVSVAFAAGADEFSPDDLIVATQEAVKGLTQSNPEHVVHLTGFKTWKSGTDAKVKIYVDHDGMTMDYNFLCAKHAGQIHCSEN